jgi:hypothetical protein
MADLTDWEVRALRAFAAAHGRSWKSKLTFDYWMNARLWHGPEAGMGAALHRLRNAYGPSWLQRYRLPKAEV